MDAPQNILVLQLARFGDFLQTTPLLAALKRRHPAANLTVLVNQGLAGLAGSNPDVDRVWSVPLGRLAEISGEVRPLSEKMLLLRDLLAPLKNEAFDLVLNLNTSRTAALIGHMVPAGRRTGPHYADDRDRLQPAPWAGFVFALMSRRRLGRFNLVDLLATYAGPGFRPAKGPIFPVSADMAGQADALLGPDHGRPIVGFQLGSNHPSRQWPMKKFARLAAGLIRGFQVRVALLGTSAEAPLGREFFERLSEIDPSGAHSVVPLMGRTTIPDLAGVLARLKLLVTTDTGTMHLAAAVGTPILALFLGPAFCHETGPAGPGHVVLQALADCSPCAERASACENPVCQEALTPNLVEDVAARLLAGDGPSLSDLDPAPAGVQGLVSTVDRFGTIYEPLWPSDLTEEEVLALAYREAGRGFLEPGYAPCPDEIRRTLERFRPLAIAGGLTAILKALTRIETGWWSGRGFRFSNRTRREPLLAPPGQILALPGLDSKAGQRLVRHMVQTVALAREYIRERTAAQDEPAPLDQRQPDMAPNLLPLGS